MTRVTTRVKLTSFCIHHLNGLFYEARAMQTVKLALINCDTSTIHAKITPDTTSTFNGNLTHIKSQHKALLQTPPTCM